MHSRYIKVVYSFFIIQVVSKNRIVDSGKFDINGPNTEATIPFRVSREMAPSARFIAYFIRDDDEIVADGLNFVVEDIYENKVSTLCNCLLGYLSLPPSGPEV